MWEKTAMNLAEKTLFQPSKVIDGAQQDGKC